MHPQRKYSDRFTCLKQAIEHADGLAQAVVHICRCPYCTQLLIIPPRPVAVALPIVFDGDET